MQIGAEDAVELFVGDVEVRRRRVHAGAVDEASRRGRAAPATELEQRLDRCAIVDVDGDETRLAAEARDLASTRSLPRSALRPATTTVAPAWAKPLQSAPPSTPVPPMTTATWPSKPKSFSRNRT